MGAPGACTERQHMWGPQKLCWVSQGQAVSTEGAIWLPIISTHVSPEARVRAALLPLQLLQPCLLPRVLPGTRSCSSLTHIFISCQVRGDEVSVKP